MAERVIQEDGLNLEGGEDGLNLEGGKDVLNLEGGNKETVQDLEGGNNTDMHSRNVSTYSSDTSMFADFHIFYPHGRGEALKTVKTRAELEPFSPRNLKVSLNPTFILQGFIFSGSHFLGLEHCGFRNVRARASSTLMSLLSTAEAGLPSRLPSSLAQDGLPFLNQQKIAVYAELGIVMIVVACASLVVVVVVLSSSSSWCLSRCSRARAGIVVLLLL